MENNQPRWTKLLARINLDTKVAKTQEHGSLAHQSTDPDRMILAENDHDKNITSQADLKLHHLSDAS